MCREIAIIRIIEDILASGIYAEVYAPLIITRSNGGGAAPSGFRRHYNEIQEIFFTLNAHGSPLPVKRILLSPLVSSSRAASLPLPLVFPIATDGHLGMHAPVLLMPTEILIKKLALIIRWTHGRGARAARHVACDSCQYIGKEIVQAKNSQQMHFNQRCVGFASFPRRA